MRATCHTHLTLLDLIIVILIGFYLEESTRYEAPDYATSPTSRYFISLRSKYSNQGPAFKHIQSMFSLHV
jgi:hypothetical protein